jgi:DNA repair protein RadC
MKFLKVKESTNIQTSSPAAVAAALREEAHIDREAFWVLHLNTRNRIIEKELVSLGTLNASLVHPREVFRRAIVNSAAAIITVHNHPSGDPAPSVEDRQIWERLNKAGELLGIEVLDHMVIASGGWHSSHEEQGR